MVTKSEEKLSSLRKRIQKLESALKKVTIEKNDLFNNFQSFNDLTTKANALYTINDFDFKCKFRYVSPSITKLAGYKPEELLGKSAFDFVHPKDKKTILLPLMKTYLEYKANKILKGELKDKSETFYYRCLDKSGDWRHVETTSNLVGNQLIMVTTDIAEQKEWEEKLKQTKIDHKQLLDNLNDIYYRLDKDGIITDINPAIKEVSGYKPKEVIGHDVRKFFNNDQERYKFIDAIKKDGVVRDFKIEFIVKNNRKIYVNANAYIINDIDGIPIGIEGILQDKTDEVLAQTALRESEEKFKSLYEDSPVEIWEEDFTEVINYLNTLKKRGVKNFRSYFKKYPERLKICASKVKILSVNKATLQRHNAKTKKDFISNIDEIFTEKSYDVFLNEICAISDGKTYFEDISETITKNGKRRDIYLKMRLTKDYNERYRAIIITDDITDRINAENAINENHRNMSFLATSALEMLNIKSIKEICQFVVAKLYKIIGEQGIVFIVDFDYKTNKWKMQEWEGLKPFTKNLVKMLGFDISTMSGSVKPKYNLTKGRLVEIDDGLYELTRGLVPKKLESKVKKLVSMESLYCIPFQKDGKIEGNVTIITNPKTKPINNLLIEAFITQVSTFYENLKIENELKESQERYKALFESSTQAICIADSTGNLLDGNSEFLKMFRIKNNKELQKLTPMELSPEYQPNGNLSSELIGNNMKNAIQNGSTKFEWVHLKTDGVEFPTTMEISRFFQNENVYFQVTVVDVTEQKEAELALKKSEENKMFLANSAVDITKMKSIDEIYDYASDKLLEIVKDTPFIAVVDLDEGMYTWELKSIRGIGSTIKQLTKLVGINLNTLKGERDPANLKYLEKGVLTKVEEDINDFTKGVVSKKVVRQIIKLFHIENFYTIAFVKDGNYLGNLAFAITDKTAPLNIELIEGFMALVSTFLEKFKAQEELKRSEIRYKTLYEFSKQAVVLLSEQGKRFIEGNGEFLNLMKINNQEDLKKLTPANISPKYQPNGKLSTVSSLEHIDNALKNGSDFFEWTHKRTDGKELFCTVLLTRFKFDDIKYLQAIVTDISEIKIAQRLIKESEEKFSKSFDASPILLGITTLDDGKYIEVNKAFETLLGYGKKDVIGKTSIELGIWNNPKDREFIKDKIDKNGRIDDYEIEIITKDKKILTVLFSADKIEIRGGMYLISSILDITDKKIAEIELQESQKRYQDLYDNAPDMYFSVSPDGKVLSVNEFGANYLGYAKEELIGNQVWIVVYPDDLPMVKSQVNKIIETKTGTSNLEFRKIRKDGSILYVQERIQCISDAESNCIELRINCRDITENKIAQKKIIDYQQNLKSLSNALIVAEEMERKRLAIALHDTVGQLLAMSKIKLSNLSKNLKSDENLAEIRNIKDLVSDAIKESRDLTYELSPPILHELGLFAACKWYIDQVKSHNEIEVEIKGDKTRYNIADEIRILLYRAVRELLNNVIKHAEATKILLTIKSEKGTIKVTVFDNGKGFDSENLRETSIEGKKFGLFSISERIEYLGGSLQVKSEDKKGTLITIIVPI